MTETSAVFDYDALDDQTRRIVEQRTTEIKRLAKRVAEDIIQIGEHLIEVKALLGHGQFGPWLKLEFDWTERTYPGMSSPLSTLPNLGQDGKMAQRSLNLSNGLTFGSFEECPTPGT